MFSTKTNTNKNYKKLINENRDEKKVSYWLFATALLILFMICVGGYTRLSKSGLSMTKWKAVGYKYPQSEEDWLKEYQMYQQTPEYKNEQIDLKNFKTIFFVEYFHRTVGNLIGFVFFIPFSYFALRKYFTSTMQKRMLLMFSLGGLQGLIGWWMVKSGFDEKPQYQTRPRVSTYRLIIHNSMAVMLYSFILYHSFLLFTPLKYKSSLYNQQHIKTVRRLTLLALHLVYFNLVSGVAVAGIDAGKVYNTWPDMNGAFLPSSYWQQNKGWRNLFENCTTTQFNHRLLAYLTYGVTTALFFKSRKMILPKALKNSINLSYSLVNLQVLIGIYMVLNQVPIEYGVLHQGNAITTLSVFLLIMALCSRRMII